MKILIVGGTGFAGGVTALHLQDEGHEVSIMGRNPPKGESALNQLDYIQGNYIDDYATPSAADIDKLRGFEAMVFAAGNDITKLPTDGSIAPDDFYHQSNTVAIPRFFQAAQQAGIRRVAYLGSFYPQVAPAQIDKDAYVASRHRADEAIRAMSCESFEVCSVNAPYILGHLPGFPVSHLGALAQYAAGQLEGVPLFAPRGGTNHVSVHSVAQALSGALARGEPGKAYLIGDGNYSWKDYLETWCAAAGNPQTLEVREDDHPLLPNIIMYAGIGATVSYEPPAEETALLGYERQRMDAEIKHCAAAYLGLS